MSEPLDLNCGPGDMAYEELCERMLRVQEAFVADLRYQAANSSNDVDIHRTLRSFERDLAKLRRWIMHTVADPATARAIIFQNMLPGGDIE